MGRECNKCVHKKEHGCEKWDCEFEPYADPKKDGGSLAEQNEKSDMMPRVEMTWEKAIEVLNTYDMSEDNEDTEFKDALALAINSLKHYKGAYIQQLRAERNIAIEQLEKLGYSLGEKIEPCKDAVSRQAVIAVAKDWWGNGVLAIDDIYKLLPVAPTWKWIPVSERLPEFGEKVLCQCQANIYEVLKLTVDGWYHDNKHCYMSGFVIAWMPLPSSYQTEMENAE